MTKVIRVAKALGVELAIMAAVLVALVIVGLLSEVLTGTVWWGAAAAFVFVIAQGVWQRLRA